MKIKILISAVKDLEAGRLFYEKLDESLGDYFFDTLFSDIDSLALFGGVHRKVYGYHRLLSRRFPYAIYYRMENKKIVTVLRILDCRQGPKKIANSLKKK